MDQDRALAQLIARLLAQRWVERADPAAQRALVDEAFRQELDRRLAAGGLRLLDNPYAGHIGVALAQDAETAVFGSGEQWLTNNLGLQRDGVALLVLLWALIILPKRERQIARREKDAADQGDMFEAAKPSPQGEQAAAGLPESMLFADFADKLGGKTRISMNLGILSRVGFIERRNRVIHEGPLLDLAFDYATVAPRIINGALADLLAARRQASAAAAPADDAVRD